MYKSGFLRCGTECTHRHTCKRAHLHTCMYMHKPSYILTYTHTYRHMHTHTHPSPTQMPNHVRMYVCTKHPPTAHSVHLKEEALLSCVRIPLLCHYSQERPGRDRSLHTSYAALTAECTDNKHYYTSYMYL